MDQCRVFSAPLASQKRGQRQTVEQIVDVHVAQVPVIQKMPNTVEAPLTQLMDMVVDVSMIAVPMIPSVQKTVEVPQVQHVEKTVDAQIVDQRNQWRKPHTWLHRNTRTSTPGKKKMSVKTESLAGDINEEVSVPPQQDKLVQVGGQVAHTSRPRGTRGGPKS